MMRSKAAVGIGIIILAFCVLVPSSPSRTRPTSRITVIGPIVVKVKRVQGALECSIDGEKFSKQGLNFQLAEMKLWAKRGPESRVLVMLDEKTTYIADIKLVPQMAVNAGFTDMQVFVVFEGAGNMAEVVYGPVKKISNHPDSR
jgi:hypothetical protein